MEYTDKSDFKIPYWKDDNIIYPYCFATKVLNDSMKKYYLVTDFDDKFNKECSEIFVKAFEKELLKDD